jgi:hypothetical protein
MEPYGQGSCHGHGREKAWKAKSLRCLPAVYPRFATNPKTKIVTAKTLNGTVLFDTIEMKTLKELFSSSYKSENCRKP